MNRRTGVIFLAAGTSSRFGRDKLREPVGGAPLARVSLEPFIAAGIVPITIVTRPERADLFGGLAAQCLLINSGSMAESIATGIRALEREADSVLIALADMPDVSADDVRAIVDASDGRRPVVPVHGRCGNPVLFPRLWFKKLEALTGDQGARALLADADVIEVPCSPGVIRDIDRATDL